MNNYYKNIGGWFTYEPFYREMADKYPDGHFVEIGTYKGKSAIFMYEYAKSQKYQITLDVVDPWNNVGNVGAAPIGEEIYQEFISHLVKVYDLYNTNPNNAIWVNRLTSEQASPQYADESLDFVFIDADHDGWACYNDLELWYVKVKFGGTIAGHDLDQPTVRKSVERFCDENSFEFTTLEGPQHCWVIEK